MVFRDEVDDDGKTGQTNTCVTVDSCHPLNSWRLSSRDSTKPACKEISTMGRKGASRIVSSPCA